LTEPGPGLVLRVEGLRKRYGGVVVLDGVSLGVAGRGRLGLIGPNGAGKTTLLDVLSGFVRAGGRIELLGRDVTHAAPARRARWGMARTFQRASPMEEWTVFENIAFAWSAWAGLGGRGLRPLRGDRRLAALVAEAAQRWGLEEGLHRPVGTLPYGTARLTEVAMATIGSPRVLLLDEPAAGLSTAEGRRVMATVDRLLPDAGIVLVEHDMDVVFDFCTELVVLDHGQVIAAGPPEAVRSDPAVRRAYLGGG
jgi:branched-chain amino acid transport system ATP-binding protein